MNCLTCHRPLRADVSLARRYGPECDPDPDERRRVADLMRRPARVRLAVRPGPVVGQMPLFVERCAVQPPAVCVPPSRADTCCDIPWGECVGCGLGLVGECGGSGFW